MEEYITGYGNIINNRITANTTEAEKLRDAGILSEATASGIIDGIRSNKTRFGVSEKDSVEDASKIISGLKGDIVYLHTDELTYDDINNPNADGVEVIVVDRVSLGNSGGGAADLEKLMQLNVNVLKKPDLKNGDSPYNTVEDINEILVVTGVQNGSLPALDTLNSRFVPSGRTILDLGDPTNKIIKDTVPPADRTAKYFADNWSSWTTVKPPDPPNKLGTDLVMYKLESRQQYDGGPLEYRIPTAVQIRLYEFNPDAVARVVGKDSVPKNLYYVYNNTAYLMEYPVFYVSGFETNDGVNFLPQYTMSDLQVNIMTGQVHFRDGSLVTNESGDRYTATNKSGGSAFVLDGVSRFGIKADSGHDASDIDTVSKTQLEACTNGYKSWYANYISNYGYLGYTDQVGTVDKALHDKHQSEYSANLPNYGSIVLRDYLEYTYMPGVVSGENLVALGRMLRLTKFEGKVTDTDSGVIGEFVSKTGVLQSELTAADVSSDPTTPVGVQDTSEPQTTSTSGATTEDTTSEGTANSNTNSQTNETTGDASGKDLSIDQLKELAPKVTIRDIMAISPTDEGKAMKLGFKLYNPSLFGENSSETTTETSGSDGSSDSKTKNLSDTKSTTLTREYTKRLVANRSNADAKGGYFVSHRFPGSYVARSDMGDLRKAVAENDSGTGTAKGGSIVKPIMYGMALDLDTLQSSLYSTWINVDSADNAFGSLNWWNSWLQHSQFNYQIDKNNVLNSINGAYGFDVTGKGYIILNLDTISKLQKMYNKEGRIGVLNLWRTVMVIIGIGCICLSALFPICWLYDTNIVVGPRFLTIVSLGQWVAVTKDYSSEELRLIMGDQRIPMGCAEVMTSSFIVALIGFLICFIDPIKIIDVIVAICGAVVEFVTHSLSGILH